MWANVSDDIQFLYLAIATPSQPTLQIYFPPAHSRPIQQLQRAQQWSHGGAICQPAPDCRSRAAGLRVVQQSQYSCFWNVPARNEHEGLCQWGCATESRTGAVQSRARCKFLSTTAIASLSNECIARNYKAGGMSNDNKHNGANAAQ